MQTWMQCMHRTKCMLVIRCRWNGVLEGWKENGEGSWRGLITQNQDIHISSNLEPYSLTSCIGGRWTSHMRLTLTIFLISKTTNGMGTFNYMCRQVLTCALNSSFEITLRSWVAFKFENFHQMLSNFVWALIYFTRSGPCVQSFKNIFTCLYWNLFTWLVKMVSNMFND